MIFPHGEGRMNKRFSPLALAISIFQFSATIALALSLNGCSSSPTISQLASGAKNVVLIQNGNKPFSFSTGVIDTASFWAKYGGSVGTQTGGTLWPILASEGQSSAYEKMDQNAKLVAALYGDSKMADNITSALLPLIAKAWGVPYEAQSVVRIRGSKLITDDQKTEYLNNFDTDADLVLIADVYNVNLTERYSVGGAVLSGVTFGLNEKSLTTEVHVVIEAFRRDPERSVYKQVWLLTCGAMYTNMNTAFPLKELTESHDKMNLVLKEAQDLSIDRCGSRLASVAKRT